MFRLAFRFIWLWGAGPQTAPPPPTYTGPFWVHEHLVRPIHVWEHVVRVPPVLTGSQWSDDPTLDVFRIGGGEG
jgi:hypothetical protein